MTQEQKELLLKDLCSRLSYGVKIAMPGLWDNKITIEPLTEIFKGDDGLFRVNGNGHCIEYIKPYLFPLSSITEEQCEELRNLIYEHFALDDEFNEGICFKTYGDILVWLDEKPINECYFIFDYFNKNHFDYRGLIPKGLAIDATNLNIY